MENLKKHICPYNLILFPWSTVIPTSVWYSLVRGLDWLLSSCLGTSLPSWLRLAIFTAGEIIIIIVLFLYPRTIPKGKKNAHNLYILIYPEKLDDDKYISKDFTQGFQRYISTIYNNSFHVITPGISKRVLFNKRIAHLQKKGKDYWESKSWKKKHRKLKGAIYVSGELLKRNANKKEHFIFRLSVTIGYNDINPHLTPTMRAEMQLNLPRDILIDKEVEVEQFDVFSNKFATFTEYLVGWAHLVSGDPVYAFNLHRDIYLNNKQSFLNNGYLKDIKKVIRFEGIMILSNCKIYQAQYIIDCSKMLLELFPNDCEIVVSVSRSIIMTSNEDNFYYNVKKAIDVMRNARMNKDTRATVYANRAYLYLLSGKYDQAENEYNCFFKKPSIDVAKRIIEYCDEQIQTGTPLEKPTAYYVRALINCRIKAFQNYALDSYNEAINNIPENHYYHKKLLEMNINTGASYEL